jgi:hypothetical protein
MARRWWMYIVGALVIAVVVGLIFFPGLTQRIRLLSRGQKSEEQARREVLAPVISTPTDKTVAAKMYWLAGPDKLAPVSIQLPLSADPGQRGKQVLHALITQVPMPEMRTLPADADVLGFYVLPDGSAVADFSDALVTETPSGIASEELVLQSITQTLESNVASLRRLKILIKGQEAETLAGHLDLTGFFDLNSQTSPDTAQDGNGPSPLAADSAAHPVPTAHAAPAALATSH